jgi:hypothetical protein
MGITSKDYLSGKRFKVEGVFSIKLLSDGAILRQERTFEQYLNSEAGVILFLKEQTPFKELQVFDLVSRKDITKATIDKANGVV